MKVLFAVSNEEISESIIKKYQKIYKQIISYKNVYYFNAILKELQKDKTYDRIVISEDLEAFTHTQYEQIDKFIFEKLDSISDEASNVMGNDTPIILICSDRRTKSEQMLVKLFGIGIYNAIIGNDRSVDEVCNLINRPRTKKDAKIYYKIDSEDVNYQAENENDVSEMEIQNILAHYKRLGKNEEKYVESFNNIAAQYNDTQLRIISKFLPLNVRAVLEEQSPKYQQIMSFNNKVSNELRVKETKKQDEGPSQILLKTNNREKIMTKPVVIPSAVNMSGVKKLSKPKKETPQVDVDLKKNYIPQDEETKIQEEFVENVEPQEKEETMIDSNFVSEQENIVEPVKRGRGRPRKNVPQQQLEAETPVKRGRGRPKKIQEEQADILPGLYDYDENNMQQENVLPGFEMNEQEGQNKIQEEQYDILPGLNDFEEENKQKETILPGFENNNEEETILPGFENNYSEENTVLPGFEENSELDIYKNQYNKAEETATLPGLESENPEMDENVLLPGFQENKNVDNNELNNQMYKYDSSNKEYTSLENTNQDYESTLDLSSLLTPGKKLVTFLGTSKNGTSFIVNNLAELLSSMGINTAILDTTKNRNSYYIYTKNEEQLRETASISIQGLIQGVTRGIQVNRNLTVYTSLPNEDEPIKNVDKVLETLIKNYALVLIDTDFNTPKEYFKYSQETYLVQTMDILTIQPLTAFLRELKSKNILDENKLRIVLNKYVKIRGIKEETIIGGMAFYNDPAMSFMTELFNRDKIKYVTIPFEDETYIRYLEGVIQCDISLKGYSKGFMQTLKALGNMVYSVTGKNSEKQSYNPPSARNTSFSPNMNDTLDKMKKSF